MVGESSGKRITYQGHFDSEAIALKRYRHRISDRSHGHKDARLASSMIVGELEWYFSISTSRGPLTILIDELQLGKRAAEGVHSAPQDGHVHCLGP